MLFYYITVKRPGLFQLSLVTSVAIRKHIKTSMYRETLLSSASMGMFGDKRRTLWSHVFKWPLICEAFNGHFGYKQTCCKLLRNTLVTSRHIVVKLLRDNLVTSGLNPLRSTMISIQTTLELQQTQLKQPWSFTV